MFGHFLRDAVGRGDTIDKCGVACDTTVHSLHYRLSQIHGLLIEFNNHPRVIAAAEVVPLLLR